MIIDKIEKALPRYRHRVGKLREDRKEKGNALFASLKSALEMARGPLPDRSHAWTIIAFDRENELRRFVGIQ